MNTRRPAVLRVSDILILTASTGGGHDSVALALQQAIHTRAPEARVRILDPLAGGITTGALEPGRWYDATVERAPWLWGLIYRVTNHAWAVRLGMAIGLVLWARRLRSIVETERPGLVVAVHPLCVRLAAGTLGAIADAPPLHCVVTDLVTIHRCWAADAVEAFYVATPDARDALGAMGIPRAHIHVTGLPVRAAFGHAPHPPAGGACPRVLILGGGYPSRRMEQLARALAASRLRLQVIVVCGRNTRLRWRLTRAIGRQAMVLGWCDDIAALMRWSSVVITRGGPTTLVEALSQARPVMIYQALPGQEDGNVTLVTRTGSGCYSPTVDAVVRALAAGPCAWPVGDMAQAVWWGNAAQKVAAALVPARGHRPAALAPPQSALCSADQKDLDSPTGLKVSGRRLLIRRDPSWRTVRRGRPVAKES